MLKRVISFLLCVNILVSMLPVQSFATEDVTESTEQIVTTEPLEETTEPSEAVTEPSEEVTMPTVAVTEPTEEITVPTEFVVEVTEPEATTESEPVCTGFVDCPVSDHDDGCEQKAAEQAAADQAAADAVASLIDALPSLEEIQAKSREEQSADVERVNAAYDAYGKLTEEQKALLPPAEDVFKPYFDYFSSLTEGLAATATSGSCGQNLFWEFDADIGMLLISGSGAMYDYSPLSYAPWYDHRNEIIYATLPTDMTSIGDCAFYDCGSLTSITIGDSVTSIGMSAFSDCISLTSITIGDSVTSIGVFAFQNCSSLIDVYITDITGWLNIPFGGGSINPLHANDKEKNLYLNGELLLDLTIPGNVASIPLYAFYNCSSIMSVTIPNSVTRISDYAFHGCSSLTSVTIPNSVTKIASYAFESCNSLEDVYYGGTEAQWAEMDIGPYNDYLIDATIHYNDPCASGHDFDSNHVCTRCEIIGGTCGQKLTWILDDEGTLTISGNGAMADYMEPTDAPWYTYQDKIKTLVVGNDVTTIGSGAFYGYNDYTYGSYKNLVQINLGNKVKSIGTCAFYKCTGITDLVLPDSVTEIGKFAFSSCSNMEAVTWSKNLKVISEGAFEMSGLAEVTLPEGLTTIGNEAFWTCTDLTKVVIPDSVTTLGVHVFDQCESLESVILPANLKTIPEQTFSYCAALATVDIPSNVTTIGKRAFYGYNKLTSVTIPECVSQIEDDAFGSSGIEEIYFTGNVPTFGRDVFYEITATVYYPANDTSWTEAVIQDYGGNITWVPYTTEHTHEYDDDHKCECGAIGGTCGENLTWVLNDEGTLTISGEGAMMDYYVDGTTPPPWDTLRNEIISLVIENGVTSIGECAFSMCENLQSIDFGQVSSIGRYAFGHCKSLNGELVIPESVTYIGEDTFYRCSGLISVTMLGNLTSVGPGAFDSCNNITTITFTGTTAPKPCSLGYLSCLRDIYVPGEALEAYTESISGSLPNAAIQAINSEITQGTCGENLTWSFDESSHTLTISGIGAMTNFKSPIGAPWSRYGHRSKISTVVIADGITSIGDYAFRNCDNLAGELVIPDSVTNIGKYAFCNSGNIDVSIGSGLLEIPSGAFSGSGIKTIDFGEITTIGDYAFQNCDSLDGDLVIPDSVITMGGSAFEDCDGVDTLTIGDGLKALPFGAFTSCDNLKCIDIGGVTNISDAAFHGCKSLTSIDFKNVTTIGQEAFSDCDSLVELLIPDTVTTMYAFSFGECKSLSSVTLGSGLSSMGDDYFNAFERCTSLTSITFTGNTVPTIGGGFTSLTALETIYVPAESLDAYSTALTGLLPTNTTIHAMISNRLILDLEALSGYDSVWIDGAEMAIQKEDNSWYIDLPDGNARVMTTYTYHVDAAAEDGVDAHRRYPIGMKVWTLNNQDGVYTATRQADFDDILQYSGAAIRVTGKQGIRMITSIDEADKDALTGNSLAGYTLKEYGTAIAWAGQLSSNKPLTLGKSYVSSNYAYKKDVADPIFRYVDGRIQYTNVLVGFNLDQCKDDIAMRPYMILEDAEGNEITIYGGIVERSIGYIALRNRKTFTENTDPYDYVWEIIHAVYGDAYDADWKPTWSDTIM